MTILYYLPSLYIAGGLEKIITFKANYLADILKYNVVILTSEQCGKNPYFKLSPNVKHIDLDVVIDMDISSSKIIRILKYPFKFYVFKRRFKKALFSVRPNITISTLRRELHFINHIKDGSIKIGELHTTRSALYTEPIKSGNFIRSLFKKQLDRIFVKNLMGLSKLVLLTNEEKDFWPELNNLTVIYNAITLKPHMFSLCENKQVIAVGRYSFQKGFDLLIQSWKTVSEKHPDWILNIYGQGNKDDLEAMITKFNLSKSCFLLPAVNNIVEKYIESSIFVLSSRYEGFGMVLSEAMTCGLPPVSFDCKCGPKDMITNNLDGILVECGNTLELASKISFLIENEDIRKEYGQNARLSSVRFNEDVIMEQWKNLFESCHNQNNYGKSY